MQSMANMCSPTRSTLVGQSNSVLRRYLETYEVDKRSIFLGNLPAEIGEVDLHRGFEKYGAIAKISLHKNESVVDGRSFLAFSKNIC
jgi:RNA recognition motif-containing protein